METPIYTHVYQRYTFELLCVFICDKQIRVLLHTALYASELLFHNTDWYILAANSYDFTMRLTKLTVFSPPTSIFSRKVVSAIFSCGLLLNL